MQMWNGYKARGIFRRCSANAGGNAVSGGTANVSYAPVVPAGRCSRARRPSVDGSQKNISHAVAKARRTVFHSSRSIRATSQIGATSKATTRPFGRSTRPNSPNAPRISRSFSATLAPMRWCSE